jgi:hypothetical protein
MSSEPIRPSFSDNISSIHDLSTSSESSVLRSLLKEAVKEYEKKVGTSLIEDQLAIRLRSCETIESINEVLEERAQAFREFRGHDRHPKMIKSIKRAVHVLHTIFTGPGNSLGGGTFQAGHGMGSVVRMNALMVPIFHIPDSYYIVIPTCEINIFRHWYPPRCMCLPSFKRVFL